MHVGVPLVGSPRTRAATSPTVSVSATTFATPAPASRRMRAVSSTWTTPIVAEGSSIVSSEPVAASWRNLSTTVCDSGRECSTGLGP